MLTAGYVRVSTESQQREGMSIEAQGAHIRRYCEMRELGDPEMYVDVISGSVPIMKRPMGRELSGEIQMRRIRHLVSAKLDRLFRDTIDCLQTVMPWSKIGVSLHVLDFAGQTIDTSTSMGKMMLTIAAGFAELERNRISERTKAVLDYKRSKGEWVGGSIPYGYSLADDGVHLEPNPKEQEIIEFVYQLREGGCSYHHISAVLESEGFVNRRGNRFSPSGLNRVLKIHQMQKARDESNE